MNVEELKEKARNHELREEWQKAFDLYAQALRHQNQDEDDSPDITLHNRVGDIQTRLGRIDGAVEQYEKAIDLYLEAELPNNAIAICKKVLRNLPDRTQFFLRMGKIRAEQGFLTDARQSFLTYAERETALGNVETALNALVEFVEISPNDLEIRRGLAAQLEAHGRTEDAVEQYLDVYRRLMMEGSEEEAGEMAEALERLSPDLTLPDAHEIQEAAGGRPEVGPRGDAWDEELDSVGSSQELVIESTNLGGLELDDQGADEDGRNDRDLVLESSPGDVLEAKGEETLEGGGLGRSQDLILDSGLSESAEEAPGEDDQEDEEDLSLPSFSFESEEDLEEGEVIPVFGFDDTDGHEEMEGMDDLPFISFGESAEETRDRGEDAAARAELDEEGQDDLPFLSLDGQDDPGEGEASPETLASEEADTEWEHAPEAAGAHDERESAQEGASREEVEEGLGVGELAEQGQVAETEDHAEAARRGDLQLAMEKVRDLLQDDPDNVDLHQRLVEYAFRTNDSPTLVEAYLSLARCLSRSGAPLKARAVFQQILALVPDHPEASEELKELTGAPTESGPREVASSEDYVDLGSLILDEEEGETTRWKVAADAPSGDEEADFAKMLGQFKEKVSEHVAADDVKAHHDLGTAYMEMGLLEEAIGEFQMALRAAPGHLPTHEVMGRCWMEMGNPGMAVRGLERTLKVASAVEDEFIGIYYLLGRAHEDLGNQEDAVEFYEKVFSLDINFEDVTERLRALR